MSVAIDKPQSAALGGSHPGALEVGIGVFAAYHLALAAFMTIAPHAFYTAVGPFGPANDHYIRDTATFDAALGVGLLIAARRPSWRVPVLAVVTIQFVLHTLNHLLDIGEAHPAWVGYFDLASLAAATALLLWLLALARRQARAAHSPSQGDTP
jgi:hypothetical protein